MRMTSSLLVRFLTVAAALGLFIACNEADESGNQAKIPFSTIEPIDSSDWSTDPRDHGMTAEEFIRSESLNFMKGMAAREGINNFFHFTALASAEDKWVVSPNNDVIYSMVVVDASKGFTLTLPDTGERFITGQIVSEEHMSRQLVGGGVYKFGGQEFNGTHVAIGVRVGTDATDNDVAYIVEQIQPQMKVEAYSANDVPAYDEESLLAVRAALMAEYNALKDTFGQMKDDVGKVEDWEKFTYVTAGAWGLAEDRYAMYLPYNLKGARKDVCYVATYTQPKVDEFWSITAYNNEKYLMSNEDNIVNSGNATLNEDGTFTVHFGPESCKSRKEVKNFIRTTEDDWGFLMRAYEPDVGAFEAYMIPEARAVDSGDGEMSDTNSSGSITKENYVVAETDLYFTKQQAQAPVNTFTHNTPVSKTNQDVIRSNRDVMYSLAVVDISEGATLSIPSRDAFQAIHIMDEQHLTHRVIRAGESVTVTPSDVTMGTHVYLLARTRITDDMEESLAAQRAMTIEAQSSKPYVGKGFAEDDVVAFRNSLVQEFIAGKVRILEHKSFGETMDDVDPTSYIYAAAVGWGGLPSRTAQYLAAVKGQGGVMCQKYTVPKPDLDWDSGGFFSLTTYDAAGWIVEDDFYIGHTKMQDDGESYSIYINCPQERNSLTVQEGWTGILRFYLPSDEGKMIEYIDSIRNIEVQPYATESR